LLARQYDGVTQWTNATSDVGLVNIGTSAFTFGAFLKTTDIGTIHAFSKGSSEDGTGFFMGMDSGEKGLFRINGFNYLTPGVINNGVFQHLMVTSSGSSGTIRLYLNGTQVATGAAPTYNLNGTGNMTLAVFSDTFNPNWDGSIDGVRFYDSEKDAATVLALSNFQTPE
jgi:hypothetical protein